MRTRINKLAKADRDRSIYQLYANFGMSAPEIAALKKLTPRQVARIIKAEQAKLLQNRCGCCKQTGVETYPVDMGYGMDDICGNCKEAWEGRGR
jgi:hypothetical protein